MSDWTYSLISAEFARQGYSDNARIGQAELNRIMDKMCMAQSGTKFDADIAQ